MVCEFFSIYTILRDRFLLVIAINQSVGGSVFVKARLSNSNLPFLLRKHWRTSTKSTPCRVVILRRTASETDKFSTPTIVYTKIFWSSGNSRGRVYQVVSGSRKAPEIRRGSRVSRRVAILAIRSLFEINFSKSGRIIDSYRAINLSDGHTR